MMFRAAVEHAKKHPGGGLVGIRLKCVLPAFLSLLLFLLNPNFFLKQNSILAMLPKLIPQFFFICLGMGGASLYLIRLARGPHVTWDKTNNPEPWNKLDPTYQYKFVAITTDYKNLKKERPDF